MSLDDWKLIPDTQPQPFDILIFRLPYVAQMGIACNGSDFLHTPMGQGSRVEKLYSMAWRCRLEGIYRYQTENP